MFLRRINEYLHSPEHPKCNKKIKACVTKCNKKAGLSSKQSDQLNKDIPIGIDPNKAMAWRKCGTKCVQDFIKCTSCYIEPRYFFRFIPG